MTATTLRCRVCERMRPLEPLAACDACGGPLDVHYEVDGFALALEPEAPQSMWRYGSTLPYEADDDSIPGLTPLVPATRLSDAVGVEVLLKREDANPTHSFKDRLAATAVAAARAHGFETVCCASTGNLAEAMAARCAAADLEAIVLCRDFDDCRRLERELTAFFPWGFVGGNLHALAAEGAKTIAYEIAEQLGGRLPDAVVAPVGSGTLLAKLAQGFDELTAFGAAVTGRPRLYGVQAGGCAPLASAWSDDRPPAARRPVTEVRSLAIGDPADGDLAVGAARMSGGAILAVPEEEIAGRTSMLAELTGVLADSAGGVALGALLELVATGAIAPDERVVLLVTGSGLELDGYELEAPAEEIDSDVDSLLDALGVR